MNHDDDDEQKCSSCVCVFLSGVSGGQHLPRNGPIISWLYCPALPLLPLTLFLLLFLSSTNVAAESTAAAGPECFSCFSVDCDATGNDGELEQHS